MAGSDSRQAHRPNVRAAVAVSASIRPRAALKPTLPGSPSVPLACPPWRGGLCRRRRSSRTGLPQPLKDAAVRALARGFKALRLAIPLSDAGYLSTIDENLLPSVERQHFEADLLQGDGNELEGKFKAVHSSAAMAVNCFGPFKNAPGYLILAGRGGFGQVRFEAKSPTGLRGGRAPNLDVLAESSERDVSEAVASHIGSSTGRLSWPSRWASRR